MPSNLEMGLYVFMLATFVGLEMIRRVSPLLHTPLMSLTNAISAISVVGAILVIGNDEATTLSKVLGFIAITAAVHQHRQRFPDHRPHAEDVQEAGGEKVMGSLVNYIYILSGALFILSLKWMNSPVTARRGVFAGETGMLLAIGGTLLTHHHNWEWILAAFFIGTAIGVPIAYIMPMTAVPQRTAMSHACGALAAALVGTAEYYQRQPHASTELVGFVMVALVIETLLGFLTFTGSLMAMGKLQEILPSRPLAYKNQNAINFVLFAIALALGVRIILVPTDTWIFPVFAGLALLFGVLLIMPIGGADMPTVIALLNSYAGLSACAMGFALDNKLLVIAGALDGSCGLILSIIMCKAMNRSFTNVLFGAFGQIQTSAGKTEQRPHRSRQRRRGRRHSGSRVQRHHRSRLRPGGSAGAAQNPRSLRLPHEARNRRQIRHPPGRRPHARPHERAAGRSRYPLRPPHRDGRNQRRVPPVRRCVSHRRQRRHQPRRPHG